VIFRWTARNALFGLTFSFKGHGGVWGIASKQGTGEPQITHITQMARLDGLVARVEAIWLQSAFALFAVPLPVG
jgi:hypothetical protein